MIQAASLRRVITWSAVIGYGLVVSGLPLPLGFDPPASSHAAKRLAGHAAKRLAGKDRATPFPCMDKPCGCATAEQCFTNCCCHTPAETLAWARANKVDPGVIATLQRRVALTPQRTAANCCEATSCCAVKKSCCEAAATCGEAAALPVANEPAEPSDGPDSSKGISLRAMLACGGIVAEWFSCGASLPPPAVGLVTGLDLIETLPCLNESASPLRAAPDSPPPRVG